jgi:HlyD family secretion protein
VNWIVPKACGAVTTASDLHDKNAAQPRVRSPTPLGRRLSKLMSKYRPVLLSAVIASILVIFVSYVYSRENGPPLFITAPIERGTISTFVKATGSVDAVVTIDVSSQLSGRISSVSINFNDEVKAGQPIAVIDPEIFASRVNEAKALLKVADASALVQQAAVERAGASVTIARTAERMADAQAAVARVKLDEAQRELERKRLMPLSVSDQAVSEAKAQVDMSAAELLAATEDRNMKSEAIDTAAADLRMAQAELQNAQAVVQQRGAALDQAELDLERTVIRSPIDGVIIERAVNPGQTVAVTLEAKTLFKIAQDLRQMQVSGKIDEADIGRLQVGQLAQFTVDAYPDRVFTGRVLQIRKAPEVVQNVVTYTAIISAPNPNLLLLPGMTAIIRIVTSDTGETLKVSNQALRFRPNGSRPATENSPGGAGSAQTGTVWVIGSSGAPVPVTIALGASDDNSTQVVRGSLQQGEQVIVGTAAPRDSGGVWGLRLGF